MQNLKPPLKGEVASAKFKASPERGGGPKGRRGLGTGENPSYFLNPPVSPRSAAPLKGQGPHTNWVK